MDSSSIKDRLPENPDGDLTVTNRLANAVCSGRISLFFIVSALATLIFDLVTGTSIKAGLIAALTIGGVSSAITSVGYLRRKFPASVVSMNMLLVFACTLAFIIICPQQGVSYELMLCFYIVGSMILTVLYIVQPKYATFELLILTSFFLVAAYFYGQLNAITILYTLIAIGAVGVTSITRYREAMYVAKNEQAIILTGEKDQLTNLKNRTGLRGSFPHYYGYDVYVAMMDVDDFKHYNDNYGHDMGDLVLRHFAKTLSDVFGLYDSEGKVRKDRTIDLYRYGGDEFMVVGKFTNKSDVEATIQRFIDSLAAQHNEEIPEQVKTSVGYAFSYVENSDGMRRLVKAADENLYEAKAAGKNQYVGGAL